MSPEETVTRSPLDKPLHQLTEEDISQLTREDCRRFLKDKGMRRPSWNKSQAIQQVISLKTLLETTPDSDSGTRKKLFIPRPENPQRVQRGTSAETPISVSVDESVPHRGRDPEKTDLSGENDLVPPRTTGTTNGSVEQMTIFYCGKVNVYDDVPADKAQVIMQIAARPLPLPREGPSDVATARHPLPCSLQAASVKVGPGSPVMILPTLQTMNLPDNCRLQREQSNRFREDSAAEGPAGRKASVQRYLEKKKDRFKSKRKVGTPSSASLDIYFNHQTESQNLNEQSSRSNTSSPAHIRPPNAHNQCSLVDDTVSKNANLSTGLDDKDTRD